MFSVFNVCEQGVGWAEFFPTNACPHIPILPLESLQLLLSHLHVFMTAQTHQLACQWSFPKMAAELLLPKQLWGHRTLLFFRLKVDFRLEGEVSRCSSSYGGS